MLTTIILRNEAVGSGRGGDPAQRQPLKAAVLIKAAPDAKTRLSMQTARVFPSLCISSKRITTTTEITINGR